MAIDYQCKTGNFHSIYSLANEKIFLNSEKTVKTFQNFLCYFFLFGFIPFVGCLDESNQLVTLEADKISTNAIAQFSSLKAEAASKLLARDPTILVLDIRTPDEFNQGHIPGALNVDYKASNFISELEKLDRNSTYLMHCRSGRRSANSLDSFHQLGFRHIIHMDDGILGWKEELER